MAVIIVLSHIKDIKITLFKVVIMAKTLNTEKKTLHLLVCAFLYNLFLKNYSADSRLEFPRPVDHGTYEQWQVNSSSSVAFVLKSLRTGIMTSFRVL